MNSFDSLTQPYSVLTMVFGESIASSSTTSRTTLTSTHSVHIAESPLSLAGITNSTADHTALFMPLILY